LQSNQLARQVKPLPMKITHTPFLAFAFLLSLTACESEAERQAREALEEQARVEAEAERLRLEEERRIIEEAADHSTQECAMASPPCGNLQNTIGWQRACQFAEGPIPKC
jgi:hypothetical protein